jgi:hypothetical protein
MNLIWIEKKEKVEVGKYFDCKLFCHIVNKEKNYNILELGPHATITKLEGLQS